LHGQFASFFEKGAQTNHAKPLFLGKERLSRAHAAAAGINRYATFQVFHRKWRKKVSPFFIAEKIFYGSKIYLLKIN